MSSGLIIVVRGVHVDRSISPAVLTAAGEIVYGRGWWKPGQLNADYAESHGIVEYVPTLAAATRVGQQPLVVSAVGVTGPVQSNFKTDLVVSDEDALLIKQANTRTKFLEQCRVAFVIDPLAPPLSYYRGVPVSLP